MASDNSVTVAEPAFQAGETVRLRTGGNIMVVVEVLDGGARFRCGWDDGKRELEETFSAELLVHASDPDS